MFSSNICFCKHHFIIIFYRYNIDGYAFSLFFIIYISIFSWWLCAGDIRISTTRHIPRMYECIVYVRVYFHVPICIATYFLFYSPLYISYVFVFVEINLSLSLLNWSNYYRINGSKLRLYMFYAKLVVCD